MMTGYDTWKAHNPADETLGPEPCPECGGTGRILAEKLQSAYYGPYPLPVYQRLIVVEKECPWCGGGIDEDTEPSAGTDLAE